jgi:glycosyltransferase involved in cell wall biosynthesis
MFQQAVMNILLLEINLSFRMADKQNKPLVVIVQRLLPHYRLPFFRLLSSRNPDYNIQVYHGDNTAASMDSAGFTTQYYKNYSFSFLGFSLVFQPSLMLDVIRKSPNLLILEGTFGVLTNVMLLIFRRIKHLPTIYWTAGWDNPVITGRPAQLKALLIGLFLRMCDGAIVYGSSAFDYLTAHGLSASKILVAQNTIDVETIIAEQLLWRRRGTEIRKKLVPNVDNLIVYVGQMASIKRVDLLLKAFQLLHQQKDSLAMLLVGKGEQMDDLKEYVDQQHVPDVYFAGEVVEGVEAYFAAGDVFVMPGTGGLALNQAMAIGLPVIATVADGTQYDLIIQGENGYIVPVDDIKALAEAIKDILALPDRRIRMGQRSLKIIQERATLRNMVEQYSMAIQVHCSKPNKNPQAK